MKIFTQKITLLIALVALLFGAASGGKKMGSGKPSNVDYYTCTMHPAVKSQDPKAKCPICGMDLVRGMKKEGVDAAAETSPQIEEPNEGGEKQEEQVRGMH